MTFGSSFEIEEALAKWQKRLRLQDWDVVASIARASKLDGGAQGQVYFIREKKSARIWLLDPADFPEDTAWPQDHEITLVHELLHLHSVAWEGAEGGGATIEEEVMVETLSRLLVTQEREICRLNRERAIATEGGPSSSPSSR